MADSAGRSSGQHEPVGSKAGTGSFTVLNWAEGFPYDDAEANCVKSRQTLLNPLLCSLAPSACCHAVAVLTTTTCPSPCTIHRPSLSVATVRTGPIGVAEPLSTHVFVFGVGKRAQLAFVVHLRMLCERVGVSIHLSQVCSPAMLHFQCQILFPLFCASPVWCPQTTSRLPETLHPPL